MKHFNTKNISTFYDVSLEAMERQSSHFFFDLLGSIVELRVKLRNHTSSANDFSSVAKTIKQYANLDVLISLEGSSRAKKALKDIYASPQQKQIKSVFDEKWLQTYIQSALSHDNYGIKGYETLGKGIVSGDFAHYKAIINIPLVLFTDPLLTDKQLTALVLYNVGYHFTYMEMMNTVVSTSQVINSLYSGLKGTNDLKRKEVLIEKASINLGIKLKPEEIKKYVNKDNESIANLLIGKKVVESDIKSGQFKYDLTAVKQTADQYVLRLGGGVALAEAFEIVENNIGLGLFQSRQANYLFAEAIRWLMLITGSLTLLNGIQYTVGAGILSLIIGPHPIFLGIIVYGFLLIVVGQYFNRKAVSLSNSYSGDTEDPRTRLLKMKEDLISQLKEKDKNDYYYRNVLEDIKGVEKVLESIYPKESFLVKLFGNKKHYRSDKGQQDLESLLNNDLFIHGHELKLS